MQRKCEYCGVAYEDSLPACPQCGAPNEYRRATGIEVPKTIEELATWYAEKNLPPEEVTRFFIGKDVREPKAFGIYKKGEDFIVYKNKASGERAERYRGTDEAYAVNELYMKLKEEILTQKDKQINVQNKSRYSYTGGYKPSKKKGNPMRKIILIIFAIIFIPGILGGVLSVLFADNGYYKINGNTYYSDYDDWYIWEADGWYRTYKPDIIGDYDDYQIEYEDGADYEGFSYSPHYVDDDWVDDDWDTDDWDDRDYDWDNDYDWDSGYSDWDSDW